MDPSENPYMPGAGTPPPELAGRKEVIAAAEIDFKKIKISSVSQHTIMVGLRGVGKTVLLNHFEEAAEAVDLLTIYVESTESRNLAELLAPKLKTALIKLSKVEKAKVLASAGLGVLKNFVNTVKLDLGGYEVGISIQAPAGVADSGDLENDLPELFLAVGRAARAADRPIAIFFDEIQYLNPEDFSALITAIHRTNQKALPILFYGAGLPQTLALAGGCKSYTERMFKFPKIGELDFSDARDALVNPAISRSAKISDDAIYEIVKETRGYPYFLQQWGYESWNVASDGLITLDDVQRATPLAIHELDQSFFRVRLDRCTPSEQKYMKALADLGAGAHRSGDVAELMGIAAKSASPHRNNLIKKGMIYSPAHGDTEFTVPLFHEFMQREFSS